MELDVFACLRDCSYDSAFYKCCQEGGRIYYGSQASSRKFMECMPWREANPTSRE
jgi:hypothetical protein